MNRVSSEHLDSLLRQFGPKRREAFSGLKPHKDLIEGLRHRGASFQTIHQVLRAQGVQTCPTMIRAYCRKVLAEPIDQFRRVVRELGNHSGYGMLCYQVQGEELPLFDASNVRQQLRNDLGAREISLTRT